MLAGPPYAGRRLLQPELVVRDSSRTDRPAHPHTQPGVRTMKNRLGNRRCLPALCLVATGALALTACGGSGFEGDDESPRSRPGSSSILIGSSGDAETKAVEDAVAAWSEESGVKAEVDGRLRPRPAAQPGLRQQQPAGRLLRLHRPARRLRQQRLALRVRRRPVQRRRLPADPGRRVHRRRRVLLRTQGLLDARAGHQHRSSGRTPASPTPTSRRPGRSSPTVAEQADQGRPGRARVQSRVRRGSARSSRRPAAR